MTQNYFQGPYRVQNFDPVTDSLEVVWAPAGVNCVVEDDRDREEDGEESPEDPLPARAFTAYEGPSPVYKLYKQFI